MLWNTGLNPVAGLLAVWAITVTSEWQPTYQSTWVSHKLRNMLMPWGIQICVFRGARPECYRDVDSLSVQSLSI
jgi:hypothetical protein